MLCWVQGQSPAWRSELHGPVGIPACSDPWTGDHRPSDPPVVGLLLQRGGDSLVAWCGGWDWRGDGIVRGLHLIARICDYLLAEGCSRRSRVCTTLATSTRRWMKDKNGALSDGHQDQPGAPILSDLHVPLGHQRKIPGTNPLCSHHHRRPLHVPLSFGFFRPELGIGK